MQALEDAMVPAVTAALLVVLLVCLLCLVFPALPGAVATNWRRYIGRARFVRTARGALAPPLEVAAVGAGIEVRRPHGQISLVVLPNRHATQVLALLGGADEIRIDGGQVWRAVPPRSRRALWDVVNEYRHREWEEQERTTQEQRLRLVQHSNDELRRPAGLS